MEESLEDYIKITRNTKKAHKNPTENEEVRNKLLLTLQKKQECEARAVKIVEFLIEGQLRPEVFLRCLKHINQSYYQDVVEERAISKLCGYSLCGKQIPDMPKKQYFISTKSNKVYDVTDRKNYCSNCCYKASIHIKQQIDNSPLWLRKFEDSPKFNILSSTERGVPGEEIDQGIVKPVEDPVFTSISSFTEISLTEMDAIEIKKSKGKPARDYDKKPEIMQTLHESEEIAEVSDEANLDNPSSSLPDIKINHVNTCIPEDAANTKSDSASTFNDTVKCVNENISAKRVNLKISSKVSKSKKKSELSGDVLQNIKKYVCEWITLDTYVFLYGEPKVKELLNENQLQEYFNTLKITESTTAQQKKYLDICRKLHLNQLAENKFDRTVIGTKMKPVPDYRKLKDESKTMNLKVRSFYSGGAFESDSKSENICNDQEQEEAETNANVGPSEVMPLTDSNSQTAIRRKVYLNSISKTMMNLIPNLGINSHRVMEDLQSLVKTFKLQANNVVFPPAIRTLIAVILLKMLSIRDGSLKAQLESKQSDSFIKLMLSHFPNGELFLLDMFANIEDISLFLKQYFSENES